jgi:hypothetical protein
MMLTVPQIGFDRFIQLDWLDAALRVRKGLTGLEDLNRLLEAAALGKEAMVKTRTKLNALVLEPRPELADYISQGVSLWHESLNAAATGTASFAWGAALATYPYFGKVAEFTGRLTAMQGDCSMPEVHRRMSELYGERGNIKTATRTVIQSQADWGVIRRVTKGNRIEKLAPIQNADPALAAWLIEAALRYQGRAIAVATLQSTAVLYPFSFELPVATVIAQSTELELLSEGPHQQFVALRASL